MDRKALQEELYGLVKEPLAEALRVINERCSPEAAGYIEFADGEGPYFRSDKDWAEVAPTEDAKQAYITRHRVLHDAKAFAKAFQEIGEERMPLARALDKLDMHQGAIRSILVKLDPEQDAELKERLTDAASGLDTALMAQISSARGPSA